MTVVKHQLHLQGHSQVFSKFWMPAEQLLNEKSAEANGMSPRSPKHQRGTYCSVQLVSPGPVLVVARGITTGLVDLLLASGALNPSFACLQRGPASLSCTVFEEVDLALSPCVR